MNNLKYIKPYKLFHGAFIPNWLLKRNEISSEAKLCYARLCQYAGKEDICYPSQSKLAAEIGTNERQIRRILKELNNLELIEIIRIGKTCNNRYRFLNHKWIQETITDIPNEDTFVEFDDESDRTNCPVTPESDRTELSSRDRTTVSAQIVRESEEENQINNNLLSEKEFSDDKSLSKNKKVKPKNDYQSQIEAELKKFGDIKNLAENFIAVAASRNKTGVISESRKLSLLCQLSAILTATGDKGVFKDALLEVIGKGIDNVNYLKKVIESKMQRQGQTRKEVTTNDRLAHLRKVFGENPKAGSGIQGPAP